LLSRQDLLGVKHDLDGFELVGIWGLAHYNVDATVAVVRALISGAFDQFSWGERFELKKSPETLADVVIASVADGGHNQFPKISVNWGFSAGQGGDAIISLGMDNSRGSRYT
jgi:hypothetical protein